MDTERDVLAGAIKTIQIEYLLESRSKLEDGKRVQEYLKNKVNIESESQHERYIKIINGIVKCDKEIDTPGDKIEPIDQIIYLMTLYKKLQQYATLLEKSNQSNQYQLSFSSNSKDRTITSDNYLRVAKKAEEKIFNIVCDMEIDETKTMAGLLKDSEEKKSDIENPQFVVGQRKPRYLVWCFAGILTSGLVVGAVVLINKNTSLFLPIKK